MSQDPRASQRQDQHPVRGELVDPRREDVRGLHGHDHRIGAYLLHGQFLSIGRIADALRDLFGLPGTAMPSGYCNG
jgi:hypothetical protein